MTGDPNTAEIRIDILAGGDGGKPADDARDLAEAIEQVNEQEEKYQKLLARRRELVKDNIKVARELHEEGLESGRITDLTPHQRAKRMIRMRQQKEETSRMLEEFGFGPKAVSEGQRRDKFRGQLEEAARRKKWKDEMGFGREAKRPPTFGEQRQSYMDQLDIAEQRKVWKEEAGLGKKPPTAAARRRQFDEQQERRAERRQWLEEAGLGPKPKVKETIEEEAQRKHHAQRARQQVQARMDELSGKTAAGGPLNLFGRLGEAAGGLMGGRTGNLIRAAMPGAGRFIGAGSSLALTALAGYGATQTAAIASQQAKTGAPWMDEFNQSRQGVSWVPGSGTFFDIKDLLSGRAQGVNQARRTKIGADIRARNETSQFYEVSSLRQQQAAARGGVAAVGQFPMPQIQDTRRATVEQQHYYELQQRFLPTQERLAEAERERAEAAASYTASVAELNARGGRMNDLNRDLAAQNAITRGAAAAIRPGLAIQASNTSAAQWAAAVVPGGAVARAGVQQMFGGADGQGSEAYITAAANQARIQGQLATAEGEYKDYLRSQLIPAAQRKASTGYQVDMGNIGNMQSKLGDLQQREQVAAGQASRLAMMGPEGRMRSEMALQMVQRYGLENLPADIIAQAHSVAPETVGKMAELAGAGMAGQFRTMAPGEFRDDLTAIRGEGSELQNNIQAKKDEAALRFKTEFSAALTDAGLNAADVAKMTVEAFKEMTMRMIAEAEVQSRVGGYIPNP